MDGPPRFYGLPLYPYFLAVLYKLFGYSPFVPGFLQAVADGGTGVLLYKIAGRVFGGIWIGLRALAAWAFYLPEEAYSVILMPTALAVFVFLVRSLGNHEAETRLPRSGLFFCSDSRRASRRLA